MANPGSRCTRGLSPGTPIGHETTGGETFAIDTSGVEEDEQPRDSGRLQGSAVSSSGASLFVSGSLRTAEILRHNDGVVGDGDRKSTRLNSSHLGISYAVFCLKKKN